MINATRLSAQASLVERTIEKMVTPIIARCDKTLDHLHSTAAKTARILSRANKAKTSLTNLTPSSDVGLAPEGSRSSFPPN
jgi:hypothetical protein